MCVGSLPTKILSPFLSCLDRMGYVNIASISDTIRYYPHLRILIRLIITRIQPSNILHCDLTAQAEAATLLWDFSFSVFLLFFAEATEGY